MGENRERPRLDIARHPRYRLLACTRNILAPSNAETHIKIVSSVVRARLKDHPAQQRLSKCWAEIIHLINKRKTIRNKVAHGQIVLAGNGSGRSQMRLADPIAMALITERRKGQFPGLCASDLKAWVNGMKAITLCFNKFLVVAQIVDPSEPLSPEGLEERFLELERSLSVVGQP